MYIFRVNPEVGKTVALIQDEPLIEYCQLSTSNQSVGLVVSSPSHIKYAVVIAVPPVGGVPVIVPELE